MRGIAIGLLATSAILFVLGCGDRDSNSDSGPEAWQLLPEQFVPAKMDMNVIHPRPPEESAAGARYKNAHPGMRYDIPIAVQGGAWPFLYQLITGPEGMLIGATYGSTEDPHPDYGVLSWNNPLPGTHTVEVRVTDQDQNQVSASWELTVSEDAFVFLDPGAQAGGDGDIDSPLQTFADVHRDDPFDAIFAGRILVLRGGAHMLSGAGTDNNPGSQNWEMKADRKPVAWVAYPGEQPVVECSGSKVLVDNQNDVYVGGIRFENARTDVNNAHFFFFNQNMPQSRVTFFDVEFYNIERGLLGNDNPAAITTFNPGSMRSHWAIVRTRLDIAMSPMLDFYAVGNFVVEDCEVTNFNSSANQPFLIKAGNEIGSMRNNRVLDADASFGIDLLGATQLDLVQDRIEVCWNVVTMKDPSHFGLVFNWTNNTASSMQEFWGFRNTLVGAIGGLDKMYTAYLENNVVITTRDPAIFESATSRVVTSTDDLTLLPADNAIDSSGKLQSTYRSTYLGTHGYEVVAPQSP